AGVAAPGWFARSKSGFSPPPLPDDLLGLLTIIVVAVQLLLIAVAMVGFNQNWHVEEERPVGGVPLACEDEDAALPPEEEEALPEEDDETLPRLEDESLPPPEDQHR